MIQEVNIKCTLIVPFLNKVFFNVHFYLLVYFNTFLGYFYTATYLSLFCPDLNDLNKQKQNKNK